MPRALPSLRALQVFEVAARLGSFTKAGEELRVTQTAVSHQIRQLEDELETPLFRRAARGLVLTTAGQAWFADLTRIFAQLRETNRKLRSEPERPLVEAAARGQGVALARWSLVQDELSAGRLCRVFPKLPALTVGYGYHLVGLRETFRRPEIVAFRSWLVAEMRELGRRAPFAKP